MTATPLATTLGRDQDVQLRLVFYDQGTSADLRDRGKSCGPRLKSKIFRTGFRTCLFAIYEGETQSLRYRTPENLQTLLSAVTCLSITAEAAQIRPIMQSSKIHGDLFK